MSPSPSWCGIAEMRWLPLSQAFVASLGSRSTALRARLSSTGTMISTHEVTSTRARPVSAEGSRRPGISRRIVGPMWENRSGMPVASDRMW